ncbi:MULTISPECIES: single-stranded-DNA-specific exonuclease RecJ [unclassified Roseateles]|uniref:single-stranded-DNA-specific exonuclease RecJ n=1 Tax=unclassified Roseateles TaxID=2626991 RepID=UPI0006F681D3|nr:MULTISPECIES: single-stranded-DNA-specific exonuclease RecJ [unclassified Roseateles]KQW52074.1 single-stranded-DNA-specific exonuclease RecJ [Pelomonas sp. Root405]KRA78308.1 single-stranded-DNA-specific exonuclease RecJ [Pelomonas sp. Root662]
MTSPRLVERDVPPRTAWALEQAGIAPLLARLLAARGVREAVELDESLQQLLPPTGLKGLPEAARLLADAIQAGERIVIVADYDCDGATACAVMLRGLKLLGAQHVGYVVPDRAVHGYGLTPTIVDLALEQQPALLVTVDNGIASLAGVAHARARGLKVLVTDHHLPALVDGAVVVPDADAIVNPNQPGCGFASKSLAGVGVAFYVLMALRAEQRSRGLFIAEVPRLDGLLDLVALGTVADVVKLDANNRRLVAQGLKRMRAGRAQPGVMALFSAAKRDASKAQGFDLGFALGPRINAAGRLADMTLGIEALTTDDPERALALAVQLDAINRERREIESGMREMAEARLDALVEALSGALPPAVALFDADFHEGVVGIVASRIKDRVHRPTFVFARGADGHLKGSGRSIPGFHLRDALDLVSKRDPDLLAKFGGHAMAAGATLAVDDVNRFALAFARVAEEWLNEQDLTRTLRHDGALPPGAATAETARLLDAQVWGQGFEAPVFCDRFELISQRLVGEKHLKLRLRQDGRLIDAIWFNHIDMLPERVTLAYRLSLDEWQGQQRVQYVIEAAA